jgi:hypothetical protein
MLDDLKAEFKDALRPPLGGYVYRFTIYLPLLSEGKPVFSVRQHTLLTGLFHACFGGYSETSTEGQPPWYGSWLPAGAKRPIIDRHTLIVLYSPQTDGAKYFFSRLRWILEQKEVANQEVVLIEHVTAWLVESAPPGD